MNPRESMRLYKESMAESSRLFDQPVRSAMMGSSGTELGSPSKNRYKSTQYNVLRGTAREVLGESLHMGHIGANGLHRYDVRPEMEGAPQYRLADYYMKELKDKKGTTDFREGSLFIVKGLHNYSNLPSGDERVLRATTTQHEQYIHPGERAPVPAKYEHLQAAEPSDNDQGLGPRTTLTPATFTPALTAPEARDLAHRTRVYRDAIEHVKPPGALDALEKLMREKIDQYAGGGCKSNFRFFDRGARGVIDLPGFKKALVNMGITIDDRTTVALFAKYDLKRRGFLDYHEFIRHIVSKDYITGSEAHHVAAQVNKLCAYLKAEGSFHGLHVHPAGGDIHAISDDEFMSRQRLKSIYYSLDRDESGALEFPEFTRMLRLIGCILSPFEVQAIWDYVDSNQSGEISFDEFYEFYTSAPPPPSPDGKGAPPPRMADSGRATSYFE